MLILIAIAVIIILLAVIMVFYHRCTKASEALFAARQDTARYRAKLETARRAAQQAEEKCGHLMRQVNASMASTSQALNVARHVEIISQQLAELFEVIGHVPADAGQPAVTAHAHHGTYPPLPLEPGMTPYGPREIPADPVSVPSTCTTTLPVTRPAQALHPGQARRPA